MIASRPQAFVALGDQRYAVGHVGGPRFAGITDLAVAGGRIAILRRQAPELRFLSFDGGPGGYDVNLPQFTCGHGLRRLTSDLMAAVDMDGHKLVLLDPTGRECGRIHCDERPGLGRPFNHPTDCAQGADGRIYVADGYGNSMVHVFGPDHAHLFSFGGPGRAPGEFSTPHSVVIDAEGRVCVADRENDRIQRFDPDGRVIDLIEGVHRPMALALRADGVLLVTDQTPRLSAFAPDGRLVGRCRTFATYAHGMDVAPDGTIALAEMAPDRVTLLRPVPN